MGDVSFIPLGRLRKTSDASQFSETAASLHTSPDASGCSFATAPVPDSARGRELHRLALILTETCNIACPYCYEHREPDVFYHPQPTMRGMTEDSVLQIVQRAYRIWPHIGALFFFGGEPLLKKHLIKRVCEAVEAGAFEGMASAPRFAMITNATLLDQDAAEMIVRHNFDLNISLDGPPAVNNMSRIDHKGRGTTAKSLENLRRLRDMGVDYHIEATVSRYHLEAGVSAIDLMDYFYDEHGIRVLHAPWVSATPDDPYYLTHDEIVAYYEPAIRYSMANLRKGIPKVIFMVDEWLRALPTYRQDSARAYCPACFSDISVNPAGDIYPCFMFNGYQYLKIGSVYDDQFGDHLNVPALQGFYATIFGPCDCPPEYRHFHSGCVGQDRIATNSIMSKPYCDVQTKLLEVFFEEFRQSTPN